MHILFGLFIGTLFYFTKSYKIWRINLSTIWYQISMVLLYHLLTPIKKLWLYSPIFDTNVFITELLYTFLILPMVALIYLNKLDKIKEIKNKIILFYSTVILGTIWEAIFLKLELIKHYNKWDLKCSFFFYMIMFLCISLHKKNPISVYVISIFVTIFLMKYFQIPFLGLKYYY